MEYDLKQWLLILGPVFIAAVLVHGYWSMRRNRSKLKMSLDKSYLTSPGDGSPAEDLDLALLKAELPNGGARVIRKPEQTALELAQDVPVLMESVPTSLEPLESSDSIGRTEEPQALHQHEQQTETPISAIRETSVDVPDTPVFTDPDSRSEETQPIDESSDEKDCVPEEVTEEWMEKAPPALAENKPEKFVIINVMAVDKYFPGQQLLEVLVDKGMTFGEMAIFHHMNEDGFSEFSLANAVEPGTFDIANMAEQATPGVTLFMRVHELADPLHAYDDMIGVAEAIAGDLEGVLQDETRSVMTAQTIEHGRQEIRDFLFRNTA